MTHEHLNSLLQDITGHIRTASAVEEKLLDEVREKIAISLLQEDAPDSGAQHLFANSDFYSRSGIAVKSVSRINDLSAKALASARETSGTADRVFVRTVPVIDPQVAGSVPEWAIGASPAQTYGPFLNKDGRQIWVDFYRIVKLVTIYRGNIPVLLFKSTFTLGVINASQLLTQYEVNGGSVWINTSLLNTTAPATKYAGVKVSGGKITFSEKPVLQNNRITIGAGVTMQIDLDLVQKKSNNGNDQLKYAADAHRAEYTLPKKWSFSIQNNKYVAQELGDMSATIFGQPVQLTALPESLPAYNDPLSQVLLPVKADIQEFTVAECRSPFYRLEDRAPVKNAYWCVPAAVLDINNPVEAQGNGSVLIECGEGLRVSWTGLNNEDIRLSAAVIGGSPDGLVIMDMTANGLGATSDYTLWNEGRASHASSVKVSFLKGSPCILVVNAITNQEMVTITADAVFNVDRPVKVNGEAFAVQSKMSALALSASDEKRLIFIVDDNLLWDNKDVNDKEPKAILSAVALENALFTVSQVTGFLLFGECDESWSKVTRANFFLLFALYKYLPTLPDPYAGRLKVWQQLFDRRGTRLTDAATTASNPFLVLVCAISFYAGETGNDQVTTGFYFGTPTQNPFELPAGQQPAPQQPQPAQPGRATPVSRQRTRQAVVSKRTGEISLAATPSAFYKIPVIKAASPITNKPVTEIPKEMERFEEILRPGGNAAPSQQPVILPSANVDHLKLALRNAGNDFSYGSLWNESLVGNRINTDAFALIDVSSNANQMGISISGEMVFMQTGRVRTDRDVNEVQRLNSAFPFVVEGMQVKSPGILVKTFTLPQVAWEPVINLTPPDREDPNNLSLPKLAMDPEAGPIYFPDDGGPTRIWNNSMDLVALAPIPAIHSLLEEFRNDPANFTVSSFTLPFGMKAIAYVSKNFLEPVKPDIQRLQPKFRKTSDGSYKLEGGIQLSFLGGDFSKPAPPPERDSPMFPGYVVQLSNLNDGLGLPSGASNLGHRVTQIFNSEFLINPLSFSTNLQDSRGVPVSRMDVTGYGVNMFSKWLSPTAAIAQTSQARFDVMMGRTGHEVVQVKSILYPWGIRVVRTITLFRSHNGYVFRVDSGWKAESDGKFDFSYRYLKLGKDPLATNLTDSDFEIKDEPYEFHPGVIRGLFNIRNIKDAPSVDDYDSENLIPPNAEFVNGVKGVAQKNTTGDTIREPVKCGGVYFDADVEIENVVQGHVNRRVVSKRILGYVQVAPAGKPLTPAQLRGLLAKQSNSIGGDIDCIVEINNSNQQMKLTRFDVSAAANNNGDIIFVAAARGSVFLPKDGSWTMVQHNFGSGEVTPLPSHVSVPLIRAGKWIKHEVVNPTDVQQQLLRIAHPSEIVRNPAADTINFGYLQSTATQKALFLTPAYAKDQKKLLSKTPPVFADAYRLMSGKGIFPNIGNAVDNFGKAFPLLNGRDKNGAANIKAFATNALTDGGKAVYDLMEVSAEKIGEAAVNQGMSLLKNVTGGVADKLFHFDVPSFSVPLIDTKGLKIYIEYKTGSTPSKLNFDVDSMAGNLSDQWKSRLNNVAMVVDLGEMKRLMTIKGNFDAKKGKASGYEGGDGGPLNGLPQPEIEFSPVLKPVIEILDILSKLSTGDYADVMKSGLSIAMSNSGEVWEYKFEAVKDIPLVRFPPIDEVYNSPQTPLKLEASMGIGVYFNAALKVTTEPGQLLPTAGGFLKFHGGLSVMCMSVGVGSIYAVGSVDVKIACDTKKGPSLALAFGFGVQIVVGLPVVGNASVTYMIGIEMYADSNVVVVAALMLFRGQAELLGGLVSVTITIEAKGIIEKSGGSTQCSAQVTFALDISIFLIIDISFSKTWGEDRQIA